MRLRLMLWAVSLMIVAMGIGPAGCQQDEMSTQAAAEGENPPVVCPAIEQDGESRSDHPGEPDGPIGVVVLGTSKAVAKPEVGERVYEVQIEKVLYGSLPGNTVRFTYRWEVDEEKPLIFALVPDVYEDRFELFYTLDAQELRSQEALSAARFDFHVLSSESIFIGKELSAGSDYLSDVEVVRSLHGAKVSSGQNVTVEMMAYMRNFEKTPLVRDEEMIYFVTGTTPGSKLYDIRPVKEKESTIYLVSTRLRGDNRPAVAAALDDLTREGYTLRYPDPTDRRCHRIALGAA